MKNWVVICIGLLVAIPVKAFDYLGWGGAPMYSSEFFQNSAFSYAVYVNSTTLNNGWKASNDQGTGRTTPASSDTKATRAPARATAKWPKKLAMKFPKDQRKEWVRIFKFCFTTYQKLEKQLGIPKNDTAGAIAAYIAGNYMAYREAEVSNDHFLILVDQMRSVLINIPEFKRANKAAKRDLYEVFSIGGTLMAIAELDLQKQPNQTSSDNLRLAAKQNLEGFLGTSIENIEIGASGLVFR